MSAGVLIGVATVLIDAWALPAGIYGCVHRRRSNRGSSPWTFTKTSPVHWRANLRHALRSVR